MWVRKGKNRIHNIAGGVFLVIKDYQVIYFSGSDGFVLFAGAEEDCEKVLDYIWHRLESGKSTCDLEKAFQIEAEQSAKWPGCGY